jgi:plastocyanin
VPAALLAAVALLAALVASCGFGKAVRLADGTSATERGRADVGGRVSEVLELGEYYFAPTVLEGRPGQRLTLTLSNQGRELHNFRVPGQHVDVDVEAGTPATATVTFPPSGAVTFECRYHLLQDMRGELAVPSPGSPSPDHPERAP